MKRISFQSVFKSVVVSTLTMTSLTSQAAVFGPPFDFKDGHSHERSDIKKKIKSFRVQTTRNPMPSLTQLDTSDVRLTMFTEVASLLEAAANPVWPATQVVPEVSPACLTHETLLSLAIPRLKTSVRTCELLGQQIAGTLSAGLAKPCRYTYIAERFVEERAPGAVSEDDLSTLEGLIAVPGEALSHLTFPSNVVTPDFKAKLRTIIAKVRTQKLQKDLDQETQTLARLTTAINTNMDCFAEPAQAQELVFTVNRLNAEVSSARSYLSELDRQGRAEALRDRRAVEARGRHRPDLPFPSLNDSDRQFLSLYLGGIYWRMRGGGLIDEPQGTQKTRYWYNFLPMKMIGYLNGGDDGRLAGEAIFPQIFWGWGDWMDMGRTPGGGDRYYDLTYMTNRGLTQISGTEIVLGDAGFETAEIRIGAMQMGNCYYFAYDRMPNFTLGATLQPPYASLVDGPTSVGELCTGAVISLGLSKSLLGGN